MLRRNFSPGETRRQRVPVMGSVFFSRPGVGVEEGSAHVLPQRGLLGLRDKRRRARAFAERRLRPVKGAYVSLKRFFAFKDVISQRSVCQNFESSFQLGCFLARARARVDLVSRCGRSTTLRFSLRHPKTDPQSVRLHFLPGSRKKMK